MNYKRTVKACYIGTICQAVIINFTALLFTALGYQFGLSYTQLGALVMVNFATQVSVAIIFGRIVDRLGFRTFLIGAHIAAVVGLAWFAATPLLPFPPYAMLMMGTLVFATAGGFMELLLSATLNAIPTDEKSSEMSIMHACFCFGHVVIAFVTTIFLNNFGREAWPIITLVWATIPLVNVFLFLTSPIAPTVPVAKQSSAKDALRKPLFIVLIFMILFAGGTEITFSQWASAFLEEAMGLPKMLGDIGGVGMFAAMMGISRIGYGILKKKGVSWMPGQSKLMLAGSALAAVSYIVIAVTYNPALGLLACALCGLGVGLLWPGTLSLSVEAFPRAGTWMFAIMAAAGNIGASAGPSIFGVIADYGGLRMGFMVTASIPLVSVVLMLLYHRFNRSPERTS